MARKKLTTKGIEALKPAPQGQRLEVWDVLLPGFGMRVTDKGRKSWVLMYRVNGRQRRYTIGPYPAIDLAEARKKARKAFRQVAEGRDPAGEKIAARRDVVPEANTFAAAAHDFINRHVSKKRPGTQLEMTRPFTRVLLARWGERELTTISRAEIIDLIDEIMDRGTPYAANRHLGLIRGFFNWCVERGKIDSSPCVNIRAPGKEVERDRVLSDQEILALWAAWEQMDYPFGPFLQLLLITAQRRSEVAKMRWQDLDVDNKVWILPRELTKSDRGHEVPLSPLAIEVVEALPRMGESVFMSGRRGDKPVSGFSLAKRRADALSGVADWRFHDLRRTAASGMAKAGTPPHVLAKILNHATGSAQGVTAIYNRYGYGNEKRHALESWANRITSIIRPTPDEKVVPLRG